MEANTEEDGPKKVTRPLPDHPEPTSETPES
jgi:hypothetical protein